MRTFSELQSIELKQGAIAQFYSGKGYESNPDELPFRVRFNGGIPFSSTKWCEENCRGKWGWIFVNLEPNKITPHCEESYLLFEYQEDAILFKLQHPDFE